MTGAAIDGQRTGLAYRGNAVSSQVRLGSETDQSPATSARLLEFDATDSGQAEHDDQHHRQFDIAAGNRG